MPMTIAGAVAERIRSTDAGRPERATDRTSGTTEPWGWILPTITLRRSYRFPRPHYRHKETGFRRFPLFPVGAESTIKIGVAVSAPVVPKLHYIRECLFP
jgi:hypothetical protein